MMVVVREVCEQGLTPELRYDWNAAHLLQFAASVTHVRSYLQRIVGHVGSRLVCAIREDGLDGCESEREGKPKPGLMARSERCGFESQVW